MKIITADQAGEILKISDRRVRALIQAGRLPAQKIGGGWIINEKDLERVKHRKPGRPKKTDKAESKPLASNKELIKNLKKSLKARSNKYDRIFNEVMERSLKKEITSKELDEVIKAINDQTMKIKQKIKKAKQALKAKTKK